MMEILYYNHLDTQSVKKQFDKTVSYLKEGNFKSADVRKMRNVLGFYRAKLDDTNRLLFKIGVYNGKKYLLLLEVILNHDYAKSKFLRGARIDESKLWPEHNSSAMDDSVFEEITYLNPASSGFTYLDKIISLDETQEELLFSQTPLILMGPAGSGKTILTLEKLNYSEGKILYITLSDYLAEKARILYNSTPCPNEGRRQVDFFSYPQFVEKYCPSKEKENNFKTFDQWFSRHRSNYKIRDTFKLFEEIRGVLIGGTTGTEQPWLRKDEYLALGVRQSVFLKKEREEVYAIFEKYLAWMKSEQVYDLDMASWECRKLIQPEYDLVVVDEVQDMTSVKLSLILRTLKRPGNFVFCGDANQVVHPNFFSWANVKRLLHGQQVGREIIKFLPGNYRNSIAVTRLANRLLSLKQARFSAFDKESAFEVVSKSTEEGKVQFVRANEKVLEVIEQRTCNSARIAIIVLREEDKKAAQKLFNTPLVFTIREAKGLEYQYVILYNFISSAEKEYEAICEGITSKNLTGELSFSRPRDKEDRTLEAYKFYINALYVGITRAIDNIYIVESCEKHPLLSLLGAKNLRKTLDMHNQDSTKEEWEQEALRLLKSGRDEQAELIKKDHLEYHKPDWEVITLFDYISLRSMLFESEARFLFRHKKRLSEIALFYNDQVSLLHLFSQNRNFILFKKERASLMARMLAPYRNDSVKQIEPLVKKYGPDVKNELSLTPLMLATMAGAVNIVKYLLDQGADLMATDMVGRTAHQLALKKVFEDEKYATQTYQKLHSLILPPYLEIKVYNRVEVIISRFMLYYFLSVMIALQRDLFWFLKQESIRYPAFHPDDFIKIFNHLPNDITGDTFRKKATVAAFLKQNEFMSKKFPMFFNLKGSYYCLTIMLEYKVNGDWKTMFETCGFYDKDILAPLNPVLKEFRDDFDKYVERLGRFSESRIEKKAEEAELQGIPDESLRDWPA